jgi:pimeloyl-ACP methyl ester carboxylesterase
LASGNNSRAIGASRASWTGLDGIDRDPQPHRRLVLLNNCGHWPPFEKPAEWTAQVLAFLKGY